MPDPVIIPPNVSRLTAAIFVGNMNNFLLLGALVVQCYYYYINFGHTDRKRIYFTVVFTFLLEIVQTILVARDSYILFCAQWGVPSALLRVGLVWLYIPILGSLMSLIAQSFWAWRLLLISKTYWISLFILACSLAQFIAGLVTGIRGTSIPEVTELSLVFAPASVWLGGTAGADLIIVAFMLYFISKRKNRTEFGATNALLSRILFMTLETGLICATFAVVAFALYLGIQDENWHLAASITLSKIYANSLVAVLNSRNKQVSPNTTIGTSSAVFRGGGMPGINISVARETYDDELPISMTDMKAMPRIRGKEAAYP